MSIPSRAEAAQILRSMDPTPWLVGHSTAVADVAAFLASAVERRGHAISVGLVEAAALLHDIDKAFPDDHLQKPLGHGFAGAEWARDNGYDEIAGAIANHPVMRLADDGHYSTWIRDAIVEERVVAYADKRAKQDVVSMDDRFGAWIERHGNTPEIHRARERANALEQEVCAAAGISPAEVRRFRWAADALDDAA